MITAARTVRFLHFATRFGNFLEKVPNAPENAALRESQNEETEAAKEWKQTTMLQMMEPVGARCHTSHSAAGGFCQQPACWATHAAESRNAQDTWRAHLLYGR